MCCLPNSQRTTPYADPLPGLAHVGDEQSFDVVSVSSVKLSLIECALVLLVRKKYSASRLTLM